MLFAELLDRLPNCLGHNALPLPEEAEFRYITAAPGIFVPPTFGTHEEIENDDAPSVILISAAGAVGKSTVARVISVQKSAPLWDLSREGPVGAHSLDGRLLRSFGIQNLGAMVSALTSGDYFVLIDALDEARVKTNEDAFQTFLSDIATMARGANRPRFVLLGRTQVTETAWLVLQSVGVPCAVYSIERFDEESAVTYVDQTVASQADRPGSRAAADHIGPYREARDAVLSRLRGAIANERENADPSEVREFLGYAPVLDAVATLLANTGNFRELHDSFASAHPLEAEERARPVAILADIVGRILSREQEQKLVRNLKPELEDRAVAAGLGGPGARATVNSFDELYSADEQATRLVANLLHVREVIVSGLPPRLADFYEEQVQSFLPEHPFLREPSRAANSVFESYLFARALVRGSPALRRAAERYLEGEEYKPSNLLAQFYFLNTDALEDHSILPEHVGILYESMRAGETQGSRVWLTIDGLEPAEEPSDLEGYSADVEFEMHTRHGVTTREEFICDLPPEVLLRFPRHLANTSMTVPCGVSLGVGGHEPLLGPGVYIDCDRLLIAGERVFVVGSSIATADNSNLGPDVLLRAQRYEGNVGRKPVVHGRLEVAWPGAAVYPWTEFAVPEQERSIPIGPFGETYSRFRRIATTLRSHKKGALARYRGKIEHRRVLKGAIGDALLSQLLRDGVLELHDNFFYWNSEKAGELVGVTWMDLRNRKIGTRLEEYLTRFVVDHPQLFR